LRSARFALSFGFPHPIPLLINSRSILGVNMLRIADNRPLVLQRCMQNVARLAHEGVLHPVVGGRFTADKIADAHAFLEGRGSVGKIVVTWS
jgi:NADPH2:quinone reductase